MGRKKKNEGMIYGEEAIEHIKKNLVPTCAHGYIIWKDLEAYLEEVREKAYDEGYDRARDIYDQGEM